VFFRIKKNIYIWFINDENLDYKVIFNHWVDVSDKDYATMQHLFQSKDYHWSLFIGHLVIERLLKAKIVKSTKEHAPYSHDLRRLAKLSGLEFDPEFIGWLDTITTFNLNARYDSYKQGFYNKCTFEFTADWIEKIKEIRKWIKARL
jgi:HEPN domain-containing protein